MATYGTIEEPIYEGLRVQAGPGLALRTDILDRLYERLFNMVENHSRVLVIRLDLRYPPDRQYPNDNQCMQRFMNSFTAHLRRDGIDFHYVWARERSDNAPNPHGHVLLLLDGRKTRCIEGHLGDAERLWALALGVPGRQGLVYDCRENHRASLLYGGTMLHRNDTEAVRQCFYWTSYLAKTSSKHPPLHVKNYGCSQL
jgi:hypothetical protein